MDSAAERMSMTRWRRKKAGLKEFRFWIKEEDEAFFKAILKDYEKYALEHTEHQEDRINSLKECLNEKLQAYGDWNTYYKEVHGIEPKKGDYPSSEKQRKFAYVIARATKQKLPDNFTLSSRILLGDWIHKQIQEFQLGHIYDWEEIAKDYKF